jgi:uncharacterized protein YegP (UPF0339 family)
MGKFVIKPAKNGVMFVLKAGNNEVIGTSEVYTTESAARNGVASVGKSALAANIENQVKGESAKNPKFEIYQDKRGEYRWRLKAGNGEIILVSEGYKAMASAKKGIASVVRNCQSEIVVAQPEE